MLKMPQIRRKKSELFRRILKMTAVRCCAEHDRAYFVGGSWKERWRADKKLYNCVAAKKGFQHKIIAPVMWLGVRAFGVSWLPTPFRWGFGQTKKSKSKKNPPKTTTSAIDQSKNVFAVENL
jgi:hypothetical protein